MGEPLVAPQFNSLLLSCSLSPIYDTFPCISVFLQRNVRVVLVGPCGLCTRAVFVRSFHSLSSHHACLSPAVELPSPESCQVIRIISPRDNLNVTFFGPLRASNLSHRFCIVLRKF